MHSNPEPKNLNQVIRSKELVERAVLHHMGARQPSRIRQLAEDFLAAAAPNVTSLLSCATNSRAPPPSGQ